MAVCAVGITNVDTPLTNDVHGDIDLADEEFIPRVRKAERRFCRTNAQAHIVLEYAQVGLVVQAAPSSCEAKLDDKFLDATTWPLAVICTTFTTATPSLQDLQSLENTLSQVHLGAQSEVSHKTSDRKCTDTTEWYTANFSANMDNIEWDLTDETSFVPYKFELVVRDNCVSSRRWTPVLQTAVNFNTTEVDAPSADKSSSSVDFEIGHCENWGLARFNSEGRTIPYEGVLSLPPATSGMIASPWKTQLGRDGRTEWVSCLEVQIPAEMFSGRKSTHFRIDAEVDCECLGSCITVVAESATVRMDRLEGRILFGEMC